MRLIRFVAVVMEITRQAIFNHRTGCLGNGGKKDWVAQEKRNFICDNLGHFVQFPLKVVSQAHLAEK